MKNLVIAVLCLALVPGFASAQQRTQTSVHKKPVSSATSPKPPASSHPQNLPQHSMTSEEAFFYYAAIFGSPDNIVDRYASYFDAANYQRSMADEFSRSQYRQSMQAKIAAKVRNVDFNEKFILTGPATIGEYSFAGHSFPVSVGAASGFCIDAGRTSGICSGTVLHVDVFHLQNAVNLADFNWALAMLESEASSFVKSRSMGGSGGVNRNVIAKITYSIVNMKGEPEDSTFGHAASFRPFIHSVEIFGDPSMTRKLGILAKQSGTPESAFGNGVLHAAQTATKTIGTYRYVAVYGDQYHIRGGAPKDRIIGAITLTDTDIRKSGEQRDGSAKPVGVSFFDSFATRRAFFKSHGYSDVPVMRIWRSDNPSSQDLRVVWDAYTVQDNISFLGFIFDSAAERDRFFADFTKALQDWATKYPQFAVTKLEIDQRCEDAGGHLNPCPVAMAVTASTATATTAVADKAIAIDRNNAMEYYLKGQELVQKATIDPATGKMILPPGCAEAYHKYLALDPNGTYVNDVKGILAASTTGSAP